MSGSSFGRPRIHWLAAGAGTAVEAREFLCGKHARVEAHVVATDAAVFVAKVDVDSHGEISQRYGVQGIPALLVFRDGDDVVLLSRSGKDLARYFPEVLDSVRDELAPASATSTTPPGPRRNQQTELLLP